MTRRNSGLATFQKYGSSHMSAIGKLGGRPTFEESLRRAREREEALKQRTSRRGRKGGDGPAHPASPLNPNAKGGVVDSAVQYRTYCSECGDVWNPDRAVCLCGGLQPLRCHPSVAERLRGAYRMEHEFMARCEAEKAEYVAAHGEEAWERRVEALARDMISGR